MGLSRLSCTGFALAMCATLVLPNDAFAFEPTGNAVADAVLESMEAGGASSLAVETVDESGSQLLLQGLTAEFANSGEATKVTIAKMALTNAKRDPDGSVRADAMGMSDISLSQEDTAVAIDSVATTGVRIPSPAEAADPTRAMGKPPTYSALDVTGIRIASEGEGSVPIDSISSRLEALGTDGSIRFELKIANLGIDPKYIDDEDTKDRLAKLGYDALGFDVAIAAQWDAGTGRSSLETFRLSGNEIGSLELSAVITGMTPQVVQQLKLAKDNVYSALPLLQKLDLEHLRIHFDNASVVERVLDRQAADAGTDRAGLVTQLTGALPAILGILQNPPFQARVSSALTAFLQAPGDLTLVAKPVSPVPLSQVLSTATSKPQRMPDLLGLEVTAND